MDTDPRIIAANVALCLVAVKADCLETALWAARNRGLYIAPELPPQDGERIATNVCLELAYISYGGVA